MTDLTIKEASRYTGLSRVTLLYWLRNGKAKGRKSGLGTHPWLMSDSEVERIRCQRVTELKERLETISTPVPGF